MNFVKTEIADLIIIEPKVFYDERGFFMETYHSEKFRQAGINVNFVQDNYSKSTKGILRGLHYQLAPKAQAKLVRVISGKIFDVAVDLRKGSPTFGQWQSVVLSSQNKKMLYIPAGFAHGFYVLSSMAEINYKCSELYCPELERTIKWDDPDLKINWPIKTPPILSKKDLAGAEFRALL